MATLAIGQETIRNFCVEMKSLLIYLDRCWTRRIAMSWRFYNFADCRSDANTTVDVANGERTTNCRRPHRWRRSCCSNFYVTKSVYCWWRSTPLMTTRLAAVGDDWWCRQCSSMTNCSRCYSTLPCCCCCIDSIWRCCCIRQQEEEPDVRL